MKRHRLSLLALTGLIILACNLPSATATAVAPTDTAVPTAAEAVDIATNTATSAPATLAPTGSTAPMASPAGQAVNCRSGPGLSWSITAVLQPGQSAQVVAQTSDGAWLEVKNPLLAGNLCWVSASYVTTTGSLSGLQIVAAPPTPAESPTSAVATVTTVTVSLSKTTINVAGCMGPIQPVTAMATITVSGPFKARWHFETQQNGKLSEHVQNFSKAGSKDISDSFTPLLTAGTYRVEFFIDGVNLKGMDSVATYTIHC